MLLLSCGTNKEYRNLVSYGKTPGTGDTMCLRSVRLEPAHAMRDLEQVLPGTVRSMLAKYGITVTDRAEEADLVLELYLQRKDYRKGYEDYTSFTLVLTVSEGGKPVIYLLHTEDTPASKDSYPFLFSLLDENIARLSGSLFTGGEREPGE